MSGYSFGIITDYRKPAKLERLIESIRALDIPQYEIRIAVDGKREGFLGKLRNQAASGARFGNIVITDDDVYFHSDFYSNLLSYGDDNDILLPRLLNPDGSRLWDWCEFSESNFHQMVDYSVPDTGFIVPTGGCIILKSHVFDKIRWDETIRFYEGIGEDYDYGIRLHSAGYFFKSCPLATLTHDDNRYYQVGDVVHRRPE